MQTRKGAWFGLLLAATLGCGALVPSVFALAEGRPAPHLSSTDVTSFLPRDARTFAALKARPKSAVRRPPARSLLSSPPAQPLAESQFPNLEQLTVFPAMNLNQEFDLFGSGREPPDTQIAVGPNSVLELVNRNATVWSKGGALLKTTDFNVFFAAAGWNVSNAHVLFDKDSGRFFASAAAVTGTSTSVTADRVILATSTTNDPAGPWTTNVFQPQTFPYTAIPNDPHIGVNQNIVVLSWNDFAQFGCDSTNGNAFCFQGSETIAFQKSDLLLNVGARVCEVVLNGSSACAGAIGSPDASRFAVAPVQSLDPTGTEYLVYNNADPYLSENKCTETPPVPIIGSCPTLGVVALTGSPESSMQMKEWDLAIPWTSAPNNAEQRGSSVQISTGDDRILSAVWRNGHLWASLTDGNCGPNPLDPSGFPAGSCARVIEVAAPTQPASPNPWSAPTLTQDFSFGDQSGSFYAYYPAVTVDAAGDMMAVYLGSNANTYPGLFVIGANSSRSSGYSDLSFLRGAQGQAPYQSDLCGGRNRFGDYSGAAADPTDPGDIWVAGEYVPTADPCIWGTAVARLTFSTPTITAESATSGPPVGGTAVVLTGTDFYADPTINGSLSVNFGGVAASRVSLQSPNQLTAFAPPHLSQPIPASVPITLTTLNGTATAPVPFTYRARSGAPPPVPTAKARGRLAPSGPSAPTTAKLIASSVSTPATTPTSSTVGYDIGYQQCGNATYPTTARSEPAVRPPAGGAGRPVASAPPRPSRLVTTSPARSFSPAVGSNSQATFGIVGVDTGFPFISSTHPGNPCLAQEYARAPDAAYYINTGYDPSYTDASHTTASCTTQSGGVAGNVAQQQAWAVGCSEAQKDYGYVSGLGLSSASGWWLDVETANSWCGQPGTNCTDLSLNLYSLQGIIDTLQHIGAVPIGIYSTQFQWTAIVGSGAVTGASWDWVASGKSTAQQASAYCSSSFSGSPVRIVQFLSGSVDRDYAC